MRYENLVNDFVKRTKDNLSIIEKIAKEQKENGKPLKVFEITQLINSCLGLLSGFGKVFKS